PVGHRRDVADAVHRAGPGRGAPARLLLLGVADAGPPPLRAGRRGMILRTIPALAVVHAFINGPIPVVLTDLLSAHLRYSGIALLADQGRRVAQRVHGLQSFAVRERRIAPS